MFQPSHIHSIPTNELSGVIIRVVPVLSRVIALWVRILLRGVVAFITQDGGVAVRRGGEALGGGGGGGSWVGPWAPWGRARVGGPEERSALRVRFPLGSFLLTATSGVLLGLRLRVLWVVSSDALFAHRTRLLGLCEPRVDALAVVGWKTRSRWTLRKRSRTWQRMMVQQKFFFFKL